MSSKEHETLRFAVGERDGARSETWRVWCSGDDVYVGNRSAVNALKVSLHQSGVFRIAFLTDEIARGVASYPGPRTDRLVDRWQQPPEVVPGFCKALEVLVPDSEVRSERPLLSLRDRDKIRWLPRPGTGRKVQFVVLLTSQPNTAVANLSAQPGVGTHLVGVLELDRGGHVIVLAGYLDMDDDELTRIDELRNRVPINVDDSNQPEAVLGMVAINENADGTRTLIDLCAWPPINGSSQAGVKGGEAGEANP